MTWNVGRLHFGRWLSGSHDSRASDEDMPLVARGIVTSGAHLVALQELAGVHQIGLVLDALGPEWSGAGPEHELFDRCTGALARRALVPRFETVATTSGRSAVAAILVERVFVSLHVDAWRSSVRAGQVGELLAWARGRPEKQVLLAGDLNIDLDHAPTHDAHDRVAVAAIAADLRDLTSTLGPTWLLGRRLDYLFRRRTAGVTPPARNATLRRDLRLPLGDHLPLVADLD